MNTFSRKICFTIALLAMLAVTITATLVHPTTVYAINDSRVGWDEGEYTVKLMQKSGNQALTADKKVTIDQTTNQAVNLAIEKTELVSHRNKIIIAVVVPVVCVSIAVAVIAVVVVKKKRT